ncbi:MAG: outer membrane beta-barrel protein [Bacteroidales bacterium]|nr:outer membrane beta-barrel protein [Bacteroidales bacterium]
MDERRANIDLAFRNGLKDYEVLPPPDAWMNIDSRIARKDKPAYFLRAAAFLAIAMTMSVLAYRWIGKTSSMLDNSVMALSEESSAPVFSDNLINPVSRQVRIARSEVKPIDKITENSEADASSTSDERVSSVFTLPQSNLHIPIKTSTFNIIRNKAAIPEIPNNDLFVDDISQEYQDYLVDNTVSDNNHRWSITALATPTYYGKINSASDALSQQIKASEQAVVSYTGGVALSYKVNKRFSIQSGLFYSSVGQDLEGINSFAGFQKYDNTKGDHNFEVLTTNGTVYTNNADVFLFADGNSDRIVTNYNKDVFDPQKASLDYINNTMRQNFSYLELPVFLRYKVVDRTVDFNLIGGLSYNLLLDNSVYTVVDGSKYMIGTTAGLNMFSISSSIGMGMEYKFSEKLALNLEPTFRYYLNSFNSVSGSQFHPYSFGIFSGISYKF